MGRLAHDRYMTELADLAIARKRNLPSNEFLMNDPLWCSVMATSLRSVEDRRENVVKVAQPHIINEPRERDVLSVLKEMT